MSVRRPRYRMICTFDVAPRQALADDRVVGHARARWASAMSRSSSAWKRIGTVAAASPRSKPSSVMATAQPLLTPPTTSSFGQVASVKKTSLNSLSPEIILIGRTSMPGWRMSTRRNEMPLCFGASGSVRASDEDVVGEVAGRGPDLLAVDDPLVAVEHGPAAEVAEVGAGVGLGVALAPHVLAATGCGAGSAPSARRCPTCSRVLPSIWMPNTSLGPPVGTPALANSSARITCSSADSPPPPYSCGQPGAR